MAVKSLNPSGAAKTDIGKPEGTARDCEQPALQVKAITVPLRGSYLVSPPLLAWSGLRSRDFVDGMRVALQLTGRSDSEPLLYVFQTLSTRPLERVTGRRQFHSGKLDEFWQVLWRCGKCLIKPARG